MKILYLGSPDYSTQMLEELSKDFPIAGVISNPPSLSDRSRELKPTPVAEFAIKNQIPLFTPENLKDVEFLKNIKSLNAEIFFVFSYGKILPKDFLDLALYPVNLHGSLLPELRGASPLQTAIKMGYTKSGWTLQKISLKMDEGDILAQVEFSIEPDETFGELMKRILPLGIDLTKKVFKNLNSYWNGAKSQDYTKVTYCKKIDEQMEKIDWSLTKEEIHKLVKALNPNPIARTNLLKKNGKMIENIKIYRTQIPDKKLEAKERTVNSNEHILILKQNKENMLFVKTKNSWIQILEIQYPNKKKLSAHDFINGKFIEKGDQFI